MPDSCLKKDNLLWRYSLRLYPDIEQWCLQMQDNHDADVNLLLLCCFAGGCGYHVSPLQLEDARQSITTWQQHLTEPLRQLRRQLLQTELQQHYSAAKQLLLDAELVAEHRAQDQLWQWWQQQGATPAEPNAGAIEANLALYAEQLSAPMPPPTVIHCAVRAAH